MIADDGWLKMLRVRNTLAHDYDGEVALRYFHMIVTDFYQLLKEFQEQILPYYERNRMKTVEKLSEL